VFILYLKSLEIQGFKSFPEKTRLTFEKPITGIVGPNGSGKSNIADAVLWVMGEQSTRTLRGGKMEDVIFGGTQRRSQLGFSEVSLILDNTDSRLGTDDSEIMLTRRYYRSGESEYYINRGLVRLKDLSEMLMDTGLGREGYSIIGQGKIAEILSTKSKDRRTIFEEAAGISRYRHRKEESERKLHQTEENLVRIGDRISELEMQIEPLQEQAEIAKRYLLLRDELRGFEIAVWLRELDSVRTRADKASTDHINAKKSLDDANIELEAIYERSESLSEKVRQCDVDTEAMHMLISSADQRLNDAESAVAVLKSQLEGNAGQIERLDLEMQNQDVRHDGVGSQISQRETRLGEISVEKDSLDQRMSSLVSELQGISSQASGYSDEISSLLKSENDNQTELSETKAELSALASQAQELYDTENSVKQELSQAASSREQQTAEYKLCLETLEKARETVVSLGNVVSGLTLKAQNRLNKSESASETVDRLKFEQKTLESRRSLLAEMEKDYEGYSKAVKIVMQEWKRGALKNIHGTVAELIKTGDNYTAAIETALGGALQNVIVDTEEDGKVAINLLKRREGGRATFLPLSTIKGTILNEKDVGGDPGFEGVALDLVGYDPKYYGIYSSLLGKVVVADNLNNAIKIANKHGHKFKIVTLDGQVLNAGGSMTGGSAVSSAGVLSRANELEQLSGQIRSVSESLIKAERELAECLREKNAADYELETAYAELRTAEDSLIRHESDEAHRSQLLISAKEMIGTLEDELGSLNNRIKTNTNETKETKSRITQVESEAERLRGLIEQAIRGQDGLTNARDSINSALSELRATGASLDAESDALSKAVLELSALRDEMLGSRERQLEAIGSLKSRNNEILDEIREKEHLSVMIRDEIEKYNRSLSDLSAGKLDLEAGRSSLNKEIQEKNNTVLELVRECSRLEQRKDTAQVEEKQLINKLWDTYGLSRSAAADSAAGIDSLAEAQRRISALKSQISELGNPNIGAIEEFERVSTRYSFLTAQRDDVEKAKSELTGIISEITTQMSGIFTREFAVINASFENTFKELFGGGHATLVLEDPSNVLECGVEIHVQPPGKSLKTLTLLSGGEKAFVAIAIYFAILTVRPPPFVVIDEIEAALDDANVLRFATHLRRMSNSTQMIVITHKRATMEEADVLYGVTMQELGVSSILRIDLEEAEKHMKRKPAGS